MDQMQRFEALAGLAHRRMLTKLELAELGELARVLDKPNPMLPATAAIVAKMVVVNPEGKILVLWRSDKTPMPGRVDLPGGGVDFGEDPINGVIREAREEAGISVHNVRIAEVCGYLHNGNYNLMLGYMGNSKTDEVRLSWEHQRYEWMDMGAVLKLEGWPDRHLRILRAVQTLLVLID